MIGKSKLMVILAALMFSLGIFSIGFGYWTDQLNLEGDANVKLSIKVTDDIIDVEYSTMEAVQVVEAEAIQSAGGSDGVGSTSSNDSSIQEDSSNQQILDPEIPSDSIQNDNDTEDSSTQNDSNNLGETGPLIPTVTNDTGVILELTELNGGTEQTIDNSDQSGENAVLTETQE